MKKKPGQHLSANFQLVTGEPDQTILGAVFFYLEPTQLTPGDLIHFCTLKKFPELSMQGVDLAVTGSLSCSGKPEGKEGKK